MNTELKIEIENLIASKIEGDYWDFKREPHQNKAELLHDILCMANSPYKGNRYIIIGVSNDCKIIGLHQNQENRKSQAQLINFLKSKKFAGDIRPEISLITLLIESKEIDVIIIKDNPLKPYYLTEDYRDQGKCVKTNYIYTNSKIHYIFTCCQSGIFNEDENCLYGLEKNKLRLMRNLFS